MGACMHDGALISGEERGWRYANDSQRILPPYQHRYGETGFDIKFDNQVDYGVPRLLYLLPDYRK